MSNGMRSCAQGARGVVVALQPVLAFCHKTFALLSEGVSTQRPAPKLKAWGKRQYLSLANLILLWLPSFVYLFYPSYALAQSQTVPALVGYRISYGSYPFVLYTNPSEPCARIANDLTLR